MKEKHSPEPWYLFVYRDKKSGCTSYGIDADDGSSPVYFDGGISESENVRRIIACVNACKGLPTELLENIVMLDDTLKDRIDCLVTSVNQLTKLAERVSRFNPNVAGIGAGMLASLVDEAKFALGQLKK